MRKRNSFIRDVEAQLTKDFGEEKTSDIMKIFDVYHQEYLNQNPNEPKAVARHTRGKIYPMVAFQRALEKNGFSREEGIQWLYEALEKITIKNNRAMNALLRIPGAYRLVPSLYIRNMKTNFGTDSGFRYKVYDMGKYRGKFDMLKCPYCDYMTKLGYPDLIRVMCHVDDVTAESMHPNLVWNRTKSMGMGGDLCDFDIYVEKKEKK